MKNIFKIFGLFWLIFSLLKPVNLPTVKAAFNATPAAERNQQRQEQRLERQEEVMAKIREKALKEIERRLASLNQIKERINALKRLTSVQKNNLTSQVQKEIENLTSLKEKIESDTDLATLRADAQSIIQAYRIYALYIPKIHLLAACDVVLNLIDGRLTEVTTKLEAKINEAKSLGKDTQSLETSLSSIKDKLANAKNQIQTLQNTLLALTPEGYPGNKTTLQSARQTLQVVHQDLQSVRQELKRIMQALRDFNIKVTPADFKPSASVTGSANLNE